MKTILLAALLITAITAGCTNPDQPSRQAVEQELTQKSAAYIAMIEEEMKSMDRLANKALIPLVTELSAISSSKTVSPAIKDLVRNAKNQLLTARQKFDKGDIPSELPARTRKELKAAQDDVRRAYHIKLEALDKLSIFIKDRRPEWITEYRRLTEESKKLLESATERLNKAKTASSGRAPSYPSIQG